MTHLPLPGLLAPIVCGLLTAFFASCSTENSAEPQRNSKPGATTPSETPTKPENASMNTTPSGIYAMPHVMLNGEKVDGKAFAGKVSLVVNVASECGYTRQYAGLQKLHSDLAAQGFQVVGFPCNDFGGQEPGSADEIQKFCSTTYGVTFPMMEKVKITGDAPSPVYKELISATGKTPSWNFCKYLVGKDGTVLGFWKSGTAPDSAELRAAIEKAL